MANHASVAGLSAQREELRYDKFSKSNSFLSVCACLLPDWAGHLVMAGKVAGTAWARAADLNCDSDAITPHLDSRSIQSYRGRCHVQTCIPYFFVSYTDKYPARNRYVWCTTYNEYSRSGK